MPYFVHVIPLADPCGHFGQVRCETPSCILLMYPLTYYPTKTKTLRAIFMKIGNVADTCWHPKFLCLSVNWFHWYVLILESNQLVSFRPIKLRGTILGFSKEILHVI